MGAGAPALSFSTLPRTYSADEGAHFILDSDVARAAQVGAVDTP